MLKYYHVSVDGRDEAGRDNYYSGYRQLRCTEVLRRKKDDVLTTRTCLPFIVYDNATYTDDQGKDGQPVSSARGEAQVYENLDFGELSVNHQPDVFTVSFWNTEVHLYRYQRSRKENQGENPFAEPQNLYTNGQGGLGIFAACNQSNRIIRY